MLKAFAPLVFAVAMLATPELGPPQESDLHKCRQVSVETKPQTSFEVCTLTS